MRIFIPPEDITARRGIRLSRAKSHYLTSVLRCRQGDTVTVIDGSGKTYRAEIAKITNSTVPKGRKPLYEAGKEVFIDIMELLPETESVQPIVLCQGVLKGEKMDTVVQKTTELGVREIFPIVTERCLVRETRKVERWQKIAEEASEQSCRATIPCVHGPVYLDDFFEDSRAGAFLKRGFIFWEKEGMSLKEAIRQIDLAAPESPVYLFIGPEGGFTEREVRYTEAKGLVVATLGKRILRAETAAIVSVALLQFLLEDLQ